jgi:hypothetical protein
VDPVTKKRLTTLAEVALAIAIVAILLATLMPAIVTAMHPALPGK